MGLEATGFSRWASPQRSSAQRGNYQRWQARLVEKLADNRIPGPDRIKKAVNAGKESKIASVKALAWEEFSTSQVEPDFKLALPRWKRVGGSVGKSDWQGCQI